MITIQNVTKRYGAFTAVDDVTFTAEPGRVTGFLGPNGAGKSTTMRVIVGLTPPTTGAAHVLGRRFTDLPNPGLEVGVLLDDDVLLDEMQGVFDRIWTGKECKGCRLRDVCPRPLDMLNQPLDLRKKGRKS